MARRQNYRLIPISGTQNRLVLGLSWQTVLGEDLAKEALRAARRAGATHYTQSGARSPAVGLLMASGRESRAKARSRLFSAAAAFAQLHPHGTQIAACELSDSSAWLAVVVNGVVQAGGDVVFPSMTAARNALADATERYGDAQVHSNEIPDARPFSITQLTSTSLTNQQSALRRASFRLSMVSPGWWALLSVLLAYLTWNAGRAWWHEREAELERTHALAEVIDATALWEKTLDTWARSVRVDGELGLSQLLAVIEQVPANPGRWQLIEVDCRPDVRICTAQYLRTRLADSHTLEANLPAEWKVQHLDLDTARVHWSLPPREAATVLTMAALPTAKELEITWAPSWQALRPALHDFTLSPVRRVSIMAPHIKLPNGLEQPVDLPVDMTTPSARDLVTNTPLRSLYALALPPATALSQLQVRYAPDLLPGLATSRFSATLKGTIYVQSR